MRNEFEIEYLWMYCNGWNRYTAKYFIYCMFSTCRANQIEIILSGSERASIPMVGALVPSVSKKLTQAGNKLCSSP